MKKQLSAILKRTSFLSVLGIFLLCSESPFDSSSNLGVDILGDEDSSLIDMGRNFHSISKDIAVLSAKSFTARSGSFTPGVHADTRLITVGTWKQEFSKAYLEYNGSLIKDIMSDTLDSLISFEFSIIHDTITGNSNITEQLKLFVTNKKNYSESYDSQSLDAKQLNYILQKKDSTTFLFNISLDQVDTIYHRLLEDSTQMDTITSVTETDSIVIDSIVESCRFGLSLASDSLFRFIGNIDTLQAPKLKIVYFNGVDTTYTINSDTVDTVIYTLDTLVLYPIYTDYTTKDSSTTNNSLLKSSSSTNRCGVIELNWQPFWNCMIDSLGQEFSNILNLSITVKANEINAIASDNFSATIEMQDNDSLTFSTNNLPTIEFNRNSSSDTFKQLTSKISIDYPNRFLEKKSDKMYIYFVLPESEDSRTVIWDTPDSINVTAVFSDPK